MTFTEWLVSVAIENKEDTVGKFAKVMNRVIDFPMLIESEDDLLDFVKKKNCGPDVEFAARIAWNDFKEYKNEIAKG